MSTVDRIIRSSFLARRLAEGGLPALAHLMTLCGAIFEAALADEGVRVSDGEGAS